MFQGAATMSNASLLSFASTSPKIAFLACAATLPGSPTRRPDAFEHDHQIGALRDGLAGRAEVLEFDWRGPIEPIAECRLALLGTAWDYTDHPAEFLTRLEALEAAGVEVCNPPQVVRWNADKHYLEDLAARGAPAIPTLWHADPGEADIAAAFDHFGCDRLVVKRRVGAGAVRKGRALLRRQRRLLCQPSLQH